MKRTERKLIDHTIIGKTVTVFTLDGDIFRGELTNEAPNAIWIKSGLSVVVKSAIAVISIKRDQG